MSNPLQVGNRVRLRSGGPIMTVARVGTGVAGDEVDSTWFDGKKKMKGRFPAAALELVAPRPAGPRVTYVVTRKGL